TRIHGVLRPPEMDWLAVDQDVSARRADDARKDLQQRRLARAIVADEAEHFALPQRQRGIGQRHHRAEMARDMPRFEHRLIVIRHVVYASIVPYMEHSYHI